MANTRWFGGFVGWMFGGPLGALLGYVIGSLVDSFTDGDSSQGFIGSDNGTEPRRTATSDRDNFLFSLLVMSACVIKADGKIMHSEMEYVRRFFRQNFGEQYRLFSAAAVAELSGGYCAGRREGVVRRNNNVTSHCTVDEIGCQ